MATLSNYTVDGLQAAFTVSQEVDRVFSTMPEPDPDWTFTDGYDHEHYYDDGYPTLEWVVTRVYWCYDCRDEHEDGAYRCKVCHEHIRPGRRMPDPNGTWIKGLTTAEATLTGDREGPETFTKQLGELSIDFHLVGVESSPDVPLVISHYSGWPIREDNDE